MKLTAAQRKRIPKKELGLPSARKGGKNKAAKGGYPMPDKAHAKNAKARATQQYKKGNLSASQRAQIDRKANKILNRGRG